MTTQISCEMSVYLIHSVCYIRLCFSDICEYQYLQIYTIFDPLWLWFLLPITYFAIYWHRCLALAFIAIHCIWFICSVIIYIYIYIYIYAVPSLIFYMLILIWFISAMLKRHKGLGGRILCALLLINIHKMVARMVILSCKNPSSQIRELIRRYRNFRSVGLYLSAAANSF